MRIGMTKKRKRKKKEKINKYYRRNLTDYSMSFSRLNKKKFQLCLNNTCAINERKKPNHRDNAWKTYKMNIKEEKKKQILIRNCVNNLIVKQRTRPSCVSLLFCESQRIKTNTNETNKKK